MMRCTVSFVSAAVFVALSVFPSGPTAQAAEASPFDSACDAALSDVQENRRVCLVGVALDESRVSVLLSNNAAIIFLVVDVYQSAPQQGQQVPLHELAQLKGRTIALGGFQEGSTVYSVRLLGR